MVQVSDQDMNTHLAEISRVRGERGGGRRLRARPPRVSLLPRPEGRAGDMLTGPGEAPARGPGVHGELGAALSQPRLPGALMDGKLSVPGTLCV